MLDSPTIFDGWDKFRDDDHPRENAVGQIVDEAGSSLRESDPRGLICASLSPDFVCISYDLQKRAGSEPRKRVAMPNIIAHTRRRLRPHTPRHQVTNTDRDNLSGAEYETLYTPRYASATLEVRHACHDKESDGRSDPARDDSTLELNEANIGERNNRGTVFSAVFWS